MKEIDKIAKRIRKRKNKECFYANNHEKRKGNKLYGFFMSVMAIYALFMGFAIYAKKDENATTFNTIFHTNMNFSAFNKSLNKLIDFRVVRESAIEGEDSLVSSNINYMNLGNDYYTSDDHLVTSLDDGVVTYVNGKDENYTVIVEFDSGVRATFSDLNEVNVYPNDRVYKDDILGSFNDQLKMIFIKDNNKITYEEVLTLK